MSEFERLDGYVQALIANPDDSQGAVLSNGEQYYVLLAADRPQLAPNDTVAYMFGRMGERYRRALLEHWA